MWPSAMRSCRTISWEQLCPRSSDCRTEKTHKPVLYKVCLPFFPLKNCKFTEPVMKWDRQEEKPVVGSDGATQEAQQMCLGQRSDFQKKPILNQRASAHFFTCTSPTRNDTLFGKYRRCARIFMQIVRWQNADWICINPACGAVQQ